VSVEVVGTETRPHTSYKTLRAARLPEALAELARIEEQAKQLDAAKQVLRERLLSLLEGAQAEAVMVGEVRLAIVRGVSQRLSKERLVELGIDPGLLRQATIVTENRPYVRVTRPGDRA
jgi:hypothetical protein